MTEKNWMQEIRQKNYPWMNDDQFECWCMFCDLHGGQHHVFGKVQPSSPTGITISEFAAGGWSTFDMDRLTRAVVMAHDRCIRFSISPSNMQNLRFHPHKRHHRDGDSTRRHPMLEDQVALIRRKAS
jgi:hypothetical protein